MKKNQSKNFDIIPDEWEFEFKQRDYHPVIMADQHCISLRDHLADELKLDVPQYDYLFTGTCRGYVGSDQRKKLFKIFFKELEKQGYVEYIFKKTLKRMEDIEKFYAKNCKRMKNPEEIPSLWKEFNRMYLKSLPWLLIPYYPSEYNFFTDRVKGGLKKYKKEIGPIIDLNSALLLVTFPVKKTILQKEQKSFYKLVSLAESKKAYGKQAQEYLKNYAFFKTFIELPIEPLNRKELEERIEKAIAGSYTAEYKEQKLKKKEDEKIAAKIIAIVQNDMRLMQDIENARELAWLLSFSIEKAFRATAKFIPFYKMIAKELHVPYVDWIHLTIDEIQRGLEGEKINKKEIAQRKKSYMYLMKNGQARIISGDLAEEKTAWIDKAILKIDKNIDEFKGQATYRGKARGNVLVALRAEDSKKIRKGEILVCSMTSPDYVPAMKQAGAIVTDEGGLLCHAAILSRELGKPCIVGTRIATQILHDGDLVEVDADKGVVRILEKTGGKADY